jgi:LEA14-like dessication related protein
MKRLIDAMRTPSRVMRMALLLMGALLLAACASMPARDPLQVTVAGIEPLTGEGMELRLLVKLRVQNPNDTPIEFNGAALNLDVMGRRFASGVSDQAGTVPRFGEAVVSVPVTVSMLRMARQFMGMLDGKPVGSISYTMSGKLHGAGPFGTQRFSTQGAFELPQGTMTAPGAT